MYWYSVRLNVNHATYISNCHCLFDEQEQFALLLFKLKTLFEVQWSISGNMFRVLPRLAALRVACQQSATVSAHHHSSSSFGYAPITVPLTDNRSLLCRYTSTAAVPPPSPLINIQTGNLANKMWRVKFISLSTSVLGICSQPYLIERSSELMGTVGVVAICGMAGFFAFITPILLHFVVKKYVIGIDYNPITDEYTATTISFFMQKNKVSFRIDNGHFQVWQGIN